MSECVRAWRGVCSGSRALPPRPPHQTAPGRAALALVIQTLLSTKPFPDLSLCCDIWTLQNRSNSTKEGNVSRPSDRRGDETTFTSTGRTHKQKNLSQRGAASDSGVPLPAPPQQNATGDR